MLKGRSSLGFCFSVNGSDKTSSEYTILPRRICLNITHLYQLGPLTLKGSPFRIFFCRNLSRLGGATSTTYGFRSEARSSFKLCGCRFSTQILPLATTVRMASSEVPTTTKDKRKRRWRRRYVKICNLLNLFNR